MPKGYANCSSRGSSQRRVRGVALPPIGIVQAAVFELAVGALLVVFSAIKLSHPVPLREQIRERTERNAQEKPKGSGACTKLRCSVACYARLSSRRWGWGCHGRLRELPDREDDTQNRGRINCNL